MTLDVGRVRAVIYDCDGVLVDSLESNRAYYNHILARFGLPVLVESQMELVKTGTGRGVVETLFGGSPLLAAAREFQLGLPAELFLDLIEPEPCVREVLRHIRAKRRTAVATNRGKSLVPLLELLNMADLFDVLVSSGDVSRSKPDPQCVHIILERLGLGPDEVLYVGDSDVDRQTAARAGTPFAAYRNPGLSAGIHLSSHAGLLEILA